MSNIHSFDGLKILLVCNGDREFLKSEHQCCVDLSIDFTSLVPRDEGMFYLRKEEWSTLIMNSMGFKDIYCANKVFAVTFLETVTSHGPCLNQGTNECLNGFTV